MRCSIARLFGAGPSKLELLLIDMLAPGLQSCNFMLLKRCGKLPIRATARFVAKNYEYGPLEPDKATESEPAGMPAPRAAN